MDRARLLDESSTPLTLWDSGAALDVPGDAPEAGSPEPPLRLILGGASEPVRASVVPDVAVALAPPATTGILLTPRVEGGRIYGAIKRLTDITICLAILPLVVPLGLLIALAIRLDSPGPVLYTQTRIGRMSRPFRIYKFRSLRADHDPNRGRAYMQAFIEGRVGPGSPGGQRIINKPISDVSVTRVGRWLRRSSLDELHQIINVLRGEMSLVGPRPNVPWEVDAYADWHRERLLVLPGITGLAQVRGRSCVTFDAIATADIEYVRSRSLRLDLVILWLTAVCLVSGDGAG